MHAAVIIIASTELLWRDRLSCGSSEFLRCWAVGTTGVGLPRGSAGQITDASRLTGRYYGYEVIRVCQVYQVYQGIEGLKIYTGSMHFLAGAFSAIVSVTIQWLSHRREKQGAGTESIIS